MSLNRTLEAIPWFLAGFAVGGAATLLLTPHSGPDTRRLALEKGLEKAENLIGEERVEKGRQLYHRGGEIRDLARDTAEVARRARRIRRPLGDD